MEKDMFEKVINDAITDEDSKNVKSYYKFNPALLNDIYEVVMMSKLELAKKVIRKYYKKAMIGIFNEEHELPGEKVKIWQSRGLMIVICIEWEYFQVFGLSEEFKILKDYHNQLVKEEFEYV